MRSPTASTGCNVVRFDCRIREAQACGSGRPGHGGIRDRACGVALRCHRFGRSVERVRGRAFRAPCARLGISSCSGLGARIGRRRLLVLIRRVAAGQSGQSTVEAAFALPIVMLLVLLLVQPGIVLYDRIVMQAAASEACRLLATLDEGDESGIAEAFVRRRLGAVPGQECFHVHSGGCSWEIEFEGGQSSESATCRIATQLKPLPFIDASSGLLGLTNESGNFLVKVEATMPTQPAWAWSASAGSSPSEWIGAWVHEASGQRP